MLIEHTRFVCLPRRVLVCSCNPQAPESGFAEPAVYKSYNQPSPESSFSSPCRSVSPSQMPHYQRNVRRTGLEAPLNGTSWTNNAIRTQRLISEQNNVERRMRRSLLVQDQHES